MNCDTARERIALYLYGELTADEEEALTGHLKGCRDCRAALEAEKRLHRLLDAAEAMPPEALVEECRAALGRAISETRREREPWGRKLAWLPGLRSPAWAWAARIAVAGALVGAGFLAGRWTAADPAGEPAAVQVRYVEPEAGGRVRIVLDETRRRVLEGAPKDPQIREALLAGVRNPFDPGVRAESVDLLKRMASAAEVRRALLYALENDPNDGVRLKALEGLRAYVSEPECRRVLSRVLLRDRNPGIRAKAVDLLAGAMDADVVGAFQELLRFEQNDYLRLRSVRALEAVGAPPETF